VIFDSLSNSTAYTVTVGTGWVCRDLTMGAPLSGKVTWAGSTAGSIYGSMNLSGGTAGIARTHTSTITFAATSTGKTITSNGVVFVSVNTFDGVGGGWTLADAYAAGGFTLTNGTFNDGGFSTTYSNVGPITVSAANSQTLIMSGTCTTSYAGPHLFTSTNATFTLTGSTIDLTSAGNIQIDAPGVTFGTVSCSTAGAMYFVNTTGTVAFATLTYTPTGSFKIFSISSNITVTGTLTLTGSNINTSRVTVQTSSNLTQTVGTSRTITAATTALTNVDFADITGAGAAAWTGTSLGNAGNNSGITFTTPVTRYGVVAGNFNATATWSGTSGGAGGATCPLAQDTIIFNASSAAGSYTSNDNRYVGSIDCTGFTRTLVLGNGRYIGSITLVSGMTFSPNGTATFQGRGTMTITSAGKSFVATTIDCGAGTFFLADAFSISTAVALALNSGTFDDNGKTVTIDTFSSSTSNTRDIKCSTTWSVTGTGAAMWSTTTNTGLTYSVNSGTISLTTNSATARTINAGNSAPLMPKILAAVGSYTLTLANVNCKGLDFTGSTVTCASAPKVAGALTLATGGTYTSFAPTMSGTSGTQSITSSGKTMSTLTVNGVGGTAQLVDALSLSSTLTLTNGTFDDGGQSVSATQFSSTNSNTRDIKCAATWSLASLAPWNTTTTTGMTFSVKTGTISLTVGGSTAVSMSNGAGLSIIIPKILIASGSYTLGNIAFACAGLDFTGSTVTTSSTAGNPIVAGNLTLATGGTYTTLSPTMGGTSGTQSITSSGKTITALTVDGVGGTASCADALTTSGVITITNGVFSCNGQSVSCTSLSSSNSNTRGITFTGSEVWSLSSSGPTPWDCGTSTGLTITPATGSIKFTNTGATSKTFAGGGKTYATVWFSGAGTGDNVVTGANTFSSIKADGTSGVKTVILPASTTTTLSAASLLINGDGTHQTAFRSSSAGTAATLSCASGTISLNYVSLKDLTATGGATFNAFTSNGCVNTSGNTGWNFGVSSAYGLFFAPAFI
jgi:hypothetical protein